MKYSCYIIYSKILDSYYIGETEDLFLRLHQHDSGFFKGCYTSKSSDWIPIHVIECETKEQARKIENHIKRMKSRKYIEDLQKYPEMAKRLLERYK